MTDPLTTIPDAWTFKSDEVAESFEDHVRSQLPWYDTLSRYIADLAVSFLPTGGTLYDIGASTGNITSLMADDLLTKSARVFSIEPSHQMAKRFAGHGQLFVIEAERVNFRRDPPDVAIAFLTMMFIRPSDRGNFLRDLMVAINPGGALILVDKGYMNDQAVQVACKAAQLAGKRRKGTSGDAYMTKELSLRGEQRPTNYRTVIEIGETYGLHGEEIFRFGEFYGLLLIKDSL